MKKKQFLVLGLGRFGRSVAMELTRMGNEVLAVDEDAQAVEDVAPFVTQAVQADAKDEEVLASFGPESFDAAVVAIGSSIKDSVLISLQCKEAGIPLVIAKATDELHAKVLNKIGVDRVIFPERDMGQRLAHSLVQPSIIDMMDLGSDYSVAEVIVSDEWSGSTLAELNIRRHYGVSVIAIKSPRGFIPSPAADEILHQGDTMIVLGMDKDIEAIQNK